MASKQQGIYLTFKIWVILGKKGSAGKFVHILIVKEYDDIFQIILRKLIIPTVQEDLDGGGYAVNATPFCLEM